MLASSFAGMAINADQPQLHTQGTADARLCDEELMAAGVATECKQDAENNTYNAVAQQNVAEVWLH